MFVHLLKTTLRQQRKAHEEAAQLKNTADLNGELRINGQPVGEELQTLILQVINLLADNCALEIEGIPENIHWTVAKNMLATAKLNVNTPLKPQLTTKHSHRQAPGLKTPQQQCYHPRRQTHQNQEARRREYLRSALTASRA